jgi:HAMP domain-containing protein
VDIRKKAPWTIIAAASVIFGAANCVSYRSQVQYIERFNDRVLQDIANDVSSSIAGFGRGAGMWAEIVAVLPTTKALLKEHDRNGLVHELQAAYRVERSKYSAEQATFVSPEKRTFLRLLRPDIDLRDDVSHRAIIVKALNEHRTQSGLETSIGGVSVRAVAPLKDSDGNPAGTFEWGVPLSRLFERLKDNSNAESALFIDESTLTAPITSAGVAAKAAAAKAAEADRIVDGYRTVESTNVELMRRVVDGALVTVKEAVVRTQSVGDTDYGVIATPILDFTGRRIGTIVVAKSLAELQHALDATRITFLATTLAGLILLAGAVQVVFNGLVLRPLLELGENADAMAGPTPPSKIELNSRSDEIGAIAKSLDGLRDRLAREKEEAERKQQVTDRVARLEKEGETK